MGSINQVAVSGRLGRDAELRTTRGGTAYCTFSLAVSDPKREPDGSWGEHVNWIDVTLWGQRAERIAPSLLKGLKVAVSGRLHQRSWDEDGTRRSAVDVTADRVEFLGQPGAGGVERAVQDEFPGASVAEVGYDDCGGDVPFGTAR